MGRMAIKDTLERSVRVNKSELIAVLEQNRARHIKDYNEALAGYKDLLLNKFKESYESAKAKLDKTYLDQVDKFKSMSDSDILNQDNHVVLINTISFDLPVPESFVDQYDSALEIAKWDVREDLELTGAEFSCWIGDKWSWRLSFDNVKAMYSNSDVGNARGI